MSINVITRYNHYRFVLATSTKVVTCLIPSSVAAPFGYRSYHLPLGDCCCIRQVGSELRLATVNLG